MLSCIVIDDTQTHHRRKTTAQNAPVHSYAQAPRDPRDIIEELLVKRGFRSLRALAMAADVQQPTLHRYMNRKTDTMDVNNFLAIAQALGITLSELMGEVPLSSGGTVRELTRLAADLNETELQQLLEIGRVLRTKR